MHLYVEEQEVVEGVGRAGAGGNKNTKKRSSSYVGTVEKEKGGSFRNRASVFDRMNRAGPLNRMMQGGVLDDDSQRASPTSNGNGADDRKNSDDLDAFICASHAVG